MMLFLLCDVLVANRQSDGVFPKPQGVFTGWTLIIMGVFFRDCGGGLYQPLTETSLPETSLSSADRKLSACLRAPLSCQAATAWRGHLTLGLLIH